MDELNQPVFKHHLAFGDVREQVSTWWDLGELQRLYDEFLDDHSALLAKWRRKRTRPDAEAFVDYVRTLTVWRRLPFLDPGLAPEVLPKDWHGTRAADLFFALRDTLADKAHSHVEATRKP